MYCGTSTYDVLGLHTENNNTIRVFIQTVPKIEERLDHEIDRRRFTIIIEHMSANYLESIRTFDARTTRRKRDYDLYNLYWRANSNLLEIRNISQPFNNNKQTTHSSPLKIPKDTYPHR